MAANTTVLIVVAAIAALVLAGMIVGVAYKTRASGRHVNSETIPDQPSRTRCDYGATKHSPTNTPPGPTRLRSR